MAEPSRENALAELLLPEDMMHKSLIPDDVVIRDFLSCVNDDTWVRHAELVNISDLKETPHEELVKEEVLRTYIEERQRTKGEGQRDLIMEGIIWQEKFMEEYKRDHRSRDGTEATNYKRSLLEGFRKKQESSMLTNGPATKPKPIEYNPKPAVQLNKIPEDNSKTKVCDETPSVQAPVVQPEPTCQGGAELDEPAAAEQQETAHDGATELDEPAAAEQQETAHDGATELDEPAAAEQLETAHDGATEVDEPAIEE